MTSQIKFVILKNGKPLKPLSFIKQTNQPTKTWICTSTFSSYNLIQDPLAWVKNEEKAMIHKKTFKKILESKKSRLRQSFIWWVWKLHPLTNFWRRKKRKMDEKLQMSFKEKQLKNIKKKNLKQRIIKHANKKDWWEAPDELQKNFTEKQLKEIKKKI